MNIQLAKAALQESEDEHIKAEAHLKLIEFEKEIDIQISMLDVSAAEVREKSGDFLYIHLCIPVMCLYPYICTYIYMCGALSCKN